MPSLHCVRSRALRARCAICARFWLKFSHSRTQRIFLRGAGHTSHQSRDITGATGITDATSVARLAMRDPDVPRRLTQL